MNKNKVKKKKKITIIESDKSITTILDFILTQNNYDTESYNKNIIKNFILSQKPNLILLDENINTKTSTNLFKILNINHPDIPIIYMIGKKLKPGFFNTTINPIIGYLYKPLDTEEIVKKVNQILK